LNRHSRKTKIQSPRTSSSHLTESDSHLHKIHKCPGRQNTLIVFSCVKGSGKILKFIQHISDRLNDEVYMIWKKLALALFAKFGIIFIFTFRTTPRLRQCLCEKWHTVLSETPLDKRVVRHYALQQRKTNRNLLWDDAVSH